MDETAVVQATTTYVPPTAINSQDESEEIFTQQNLQPEELLNVIVHPVLGNIVAYLSGWVVRKALRKLTCEPCRLALIKSKANGKYDDLNILLELKNNGGLISPSDGVISTVLCTEKHIKEAITVGQPMKHLKILRSVKAEIGHYDVFDLKDHYEVTSVGIDNHHFSLIAVIVNTYYDLRQHHIAKIRNLNMHKVNVRHNATKSILFRGQ